MTQIKALLFDMDGLLLDTERLAKLSFDRTLDSLGEPPRDGLFNSLIGMNQVTSRQTLARDLPKHIDLEHFRTTWNHHYFEATSATIPLRPRVTEALELVKGRFPLIVATSTKRSVARDKLDRTNLLGYFDDLIGGDQVSNGKPDPEIFVRAADLAGIAPAHCAAFEDSENGVRAAHGAGCKVVQIPDLVDPSDALRRLGHAIAPDLPAAFRMLGLIG